MLIVEKKLLKFVNVHVIDVLQPLGEIACCVITVHECSTPLTHPCFWHFTISNCILGLWWVAGSFRPSFTKNMVTNCCSPSYWLLQKPSWSMKKRTCTSVVRGWRKTILNNYAEVPLYYEKQWTFWVRLFAYVSVPTSPLASPCHWEQALHSYNIGRCQNVKKKTKNKQTNKQTQQYKMFVLHW
jgi:hypothetical protein